MKEILLALVAEVEDLRANLAVQAAYTSHPPAVAAARDAKKRAIQDSKKSYDALRAKIEQLYS